MLWGSGGRCSAPSPRPPPARGGGFSAGLFFLAAEEGGRGADEAGGGHGHQRAVLGEPREEGERDVLGRIGGKILDRPAAAAADCRDDDQGKQRAEEEKSGGDQPGERCADERKKRHV